MYPNKQTNKTKTFPPASGLVLNQWSGYGSLAKLTYRVNHCRVFLHLACVQVAPRITVISSGHLETCHLSLPALTFPSSIEFPFSVLIDWKLPLLQQLPCCNHCFLAYSPSHYTCLKGESFVLFTFTLQQAEWDVRCLYNK